MSNNLSVKQQVVAASQEAVSQKSSQLQAPKKSQRGRPPKNKSNNQSLNSTLAKSDDGRDMSVAGNSQKPLDSPTMNPNTEQISTLKNQQSPVISKKRKLSEITPDQECNGDEGASGPIEERPASKRFKGNNGEIICSSKRGSKQLEHSSSQSNDTPPKEEVGNQVSQTSELQEHAIQTVEILTTSPKEKQTEEEQQQQDQPSKCSSKSKEEVQLQPLPESSDEKGDSMDLKELKNALETNEEPLDNKEVHPNQDDTEQMEHQSEPMNIVETIQQPEETIQQPPLTQSAFNEKYLETDVPLNQTNIEADVTQEEDVRHHDEEGVITKEQRLFTEATDHDEVIDQNQIQAYKEIQEEGPQSDVVIGLSNPQQ